MVHTQHQSPGEIIIIIMYIYHALINALSAHMIHINRNTIFYTHVEHSPIKTIYIRYYIKRREVSWTLTKKLVQERSRTGRWCWAGELDFFCFSCFPTAELRTLSL